MMRRFAERASVDQKKVRDDDLHDIVVAPIAGGVERIPVDRGGGANRGRYDMPPEAFGLDKNGGRKAHAVANPDGPFGPAFAVAPTRPEPAAQNGTCFIINQHNVRIRNPWTTARLNNEPNTAGDPFDRPLLARDKVDDFEILLAGPGGKIYCAEKKNGALSLGELTDLGYEGDIWYQLRGGVVAGSASCFQKQGRVLPLVNITSLTRGS
jgi:hypothetical protein